METRKLYYEDCHTKSFTAQVVSCTPGKGGWQVCLDATAFYPEGGGQACDLGTLGSARVLDVREEGEKVCHLCDRPLDPGTQVQGQIQWQRRFDLMQQHSGEHIVSGIIHRRFGYHNVGFHVGADTVTVDFDGPVTEQALEEIQQEANRAVWENLSIRCWYPTAQELPQVGYRSKRELPWPVRVVEVPGYDKCACCGVHTAFTGEIGLILLLSCVKFHQGVRIEMVCGRRALAYITGICRENKQVSQLFSAKPLETGAAAQRVSQQLAGEKLRAGELEKRVFAAIAEKYTGRGNVLHIEPGLTPGSLRELTDRIAEVCGGIAVAVSGGNLCLVSREQDVRELGKAAFQALGGRGGGKPGAVQGSVAAEGEQIRKFFRESGFFVLFAE